MSSNVHAALARALRTFEAAAVPVLGLALVMFQSGHIGISDATKVGLALAAAVIAGASAFFLQLGSVVAKTPIGKAATQVAQTFGVGVGVLVVANLTIADGIALAHALIYLAGSSIVSGLIVLVRSNSEAKAVTAGA